MQNLETLYDMRASWQACNVRLTPVMHPKALFKNNAAVVLAGFLPTM